MSLEIFARQSLAQFAIIYAEIFEGNDGKAIKPSEIETLMWGRMCAKEAGIVKAGFKIPYDNIKRAKVTLPYMPDDINYTGCCAIKKNGGLYTPCCGKVAEGTYYCKSCSVDKEGESKEIEFGAMDDRDQNVEDGRFAPITFAEWMKGHKTTLPEVYAKLRDAGIALEIPANELTCRELPKRRKGRPAKSDDSVVDEDTVPKKGKAKSPAASDDEKPKKKAKAVKAESDSESEVDKTKAKKAKASEDEAPKTKAKKAEPKKASPAASEDEAPKPKAKKADAKPKVKEPEPESEDDAPKPKKAKSPAASEDEAPKTKKAKAPEPKKAKSPAASEDEAPKKAKKAKKAEASEDEAPKPKAKKAEAEKPKAKKASSGSESDTPKKAKKAKAPEPEPEPETLEAEDAEDEDEEDQEISIDGVDYTLRNGKFVIAKDDGRIVATVNDEGEPEWVDGEEP